MGCFIILRIDSARLNTRLNTSISQFKICKSFLLPHFSGSLEEDFSQDIYVSKYIHFDNEYRISFGPLGCIALKAMNYIKIIN